MPSAASVLETGPGRGLEQAGDLIQREHPQQLPRIVGEGQLMGDYRQLR
jgi:hypothetical protein